MTKLNYALKDYNMQKACLWGNCVGHYRSVFEGKGSLGHRTIHLLIALAESLPLLSQIASLIEWVSVELFSDKKNKIIDFYKDFKDRVAPIDINDLDEMENEYQTYLKTHHIFIRFFINLGWLPTSVKGAYNQAFNSLVEKEAVDFVESYDSVKGEAYGYLAHIMKKKHHQIFYQKVLSKSSEILKDRLKKGSKNPKGLIWKVVNSKGIENFLIGTIHKNFKWFENAKGLQEAVNESEVFFTEIKSDDDTLDGYVRSSAMKQNKPHIALDSDKLRKDADDKEKNDPPKNGFNRKLAKLLIKWDKSINIKEINDKIRDKSSKILKEIYVKKVMEIWQKGDVQQAKNFISIDSSNSGADSCDIRTRAWLDGHEGIENSGLIERILETEKPICIAVGTAHCIGNKEELVEEFKKAGCTVTPYQP